ITRQDRLAVRFKPFDPTQADADRRDIGNIGAGPYCHDPIERYCRGRIDPTQLPMRHWRAHDPHVKLMRKRNVGGEPTVAGDKRLVFEPPHRAADMRHSGCLGSSHHLAAFIAAAAAATAFKMFWYPVQRHRLEDSTSRISSSPTSGFCSNNATESIRKPGVQ